MKKCKYCDSEVAQGETACPNCGASDFLNICDCCGAAFDDGIVCPNCGVKVGTVPKTCPRCSRSYYGTSCSHCGYTESQSPFPGSESVKRVSPIFWILGVLFCFPLTLVFFFLRKSDAAGTLQKVLRTIIIVVISLMLLNMVTTAITSLLT